MYDNVKDDKWTSKVVLCIFSYFSISEIYQLQSSDTTLKANQALVEVQDEVECGITGQMGLALYAVRGHVIVFLEIALNNFSWSHVSFQYSNVFSFRHFCRSGRKRMLQKISIVVSNIHHGFKRACTPEMKRLKLSPHWTVWERRTQNTPKGSYLRDMIKLDIFWAFLKCKFSEYVNTNIWMYQA